MPNPVKLPIITREQQVKNLPPALRQDPVVGDPKQPPENGKYAPAGGSDNPVEQLTAQLRALEQARNEARAQAEGAAVNAPSDALRQQVEQRVQGLDSAYAELTKALSQLIGNGQVHVSLQSLGVVIDINETLLFNSGKAELTPTALPLIDQIARILVGLHYQIQVNGFTDNVPIHNAQFDSNWDLSATRAISVVKRFVAAGIDPTLMVGAGFGEYHPVGPNDTLDGRASNRRVSIVVVSPIEGTDPAKTRLLGSTTERRPFGAGEAPTSPQPVSVPDPASAPAR
ncbi:MAG: OmpA family protein [Alphaproteobacteria bacterium]|nr:OmpA family protein [Alphaproteobacteria bacterium]